jgi:hypothetical protein
VAFPSAFSVTPTVVASAYGSVNDFIDRIDSSYISNITTSNFTFNTDMEFTLSSVIANVEGSVSLLYNANSTVLSNGYPAAAYYTNTGLRFSRNLSQDGSGAWVNQVVDATGFGPWLVTLSDGTPGISYTNSTNTTLQFARNSLVNGDGVWTKYTVDGTGGSYFTNSAVLADGTIGISYFGTSGSQLKFARNSAANGSGVWTINTIDGITGGLARASTAILADNSVAVAYTDETLSTIKFARNSSPTGSATWEVVTVDAGPGVPSLCVLADNTVGIGYYQGGPSGALKFARNTSISGTGTWNITTLATGFVAGVALNRLYNGLPAISYKNLANATLNFAQNSTIAGDGTWTFTNITSTSGNASAVSLNILSDSRPAILHNTSNNNGELTLTRSALKDRYPNDTPFNITWMAK